jgi:hypothetical protein
MLYFMIMNRLYSDAFSIVSLTMCTMRSNHINRTVSYATMHIKDVAHLLPSKLYPLTYAVFSSLAKDKSSGVMSIPTTFASCLSAVIAVSSYFPEKSTLLPYNIAIAARINAIHIPDF